jgi:redox-regulated HSP33 family molecular chaperone
MNKKDILFFNKKIKMYLSQIYTNHSIRATGATILGRNCSMAQIMAVTGHKSASLSLKTAFNLVKIHLLFRIMILIQ